MKRLVLYRHAKAERHRSADHSRELSARGRRDATTMAALWREANLGVDRVLLSTAERTRQTWSYTAAGLPGSDAPEVLLLDSLYGASARELQEILGRHAGEAGSVCVVGHNPGLSQLAGWLGVRGAALPRMRTGMAVVLEHAGAIWAEALADLHGWPVERVLLARDRS